MFEMKHVDEASLLRCAHGARFPNHDNEAGCFVYIVPPSQKGAPFDLGLWNLLLYLIVDCGIVAPT
jgi:hypothetical protein